MIQPTEKVIKALQNLRRSNPEAYGDIGEWIGLNAIAGGMEISNIRDVNDMLRCSGRNQVFQTLNLYFNGTEEAIGKLKAFQQQAQTMGKANG